MINNKDIISNSKIEYSKADKENQSINNEANEVIDFDDNQEKNTLESPKNSDGKQSKAKTNSTTTHRKSNFKIK